MSKIKLYGQGLFNEQLLRNYYLLGLYTGLEPKIVREGSNHRFGDTYYKAVWTTRKDATRHGGIQLSYETWGGRSPPRLRAHVWQRSAAELISDLGEWL